MKTSSDTTFSGKTFSKYRNFLNISYKNPHLSKNQLVENFFWQLTSKKNLERIPVGITAEENKNSEMENIKTHYPSSEIMKLYSSEILDKQNSFADEPNPQKSAVFNWDRCSENPFFELWGYASYEKSFLKVYLALAKKFLETKYVKSSEIVDEQSILENTKDVDNPNKIGKINDKPLDNSYVDKILRDKLGPWGIIKSFTNNKNGDPRGNWHTISDIPEELDFCNSNIYSKILAYSKTGPCSVIGHYLMEKFFDKEKFARPQIQSWEKKFMLPSLDSEVMYKIFNAIQQGMKIRIEFYDFSRSFPEPVIPLCIVQNMKNGSFDFIYNHNRKYFSEPIAEIKDVYDADETFNHAEEIVKIEELLPKVWEYRRGRVFWGLQHIFIRLIGLDNFSEIKECLSPVFEVLQKDDSIEIHGECFDATSFIPVLRSFLGRIKDFNFYEEVRDSSGEARNVQLLWTTDYLSNQTFYNSIKDLFEQYCIRIGKDLLVPERKTSEESFQCEFGSPRKLPEDFFQKNYKEDTVLFNSFYSRDFIENVQKKNLPLPITNAEYRWFYSILDYDCDADEEYESDGFDKLRNYFMGQRLDKLFTKSSFRRIRTPFADKIYEKSSGKECYLELSKEATELFTFFPQCRDNLKLTNYGGLGKVTTWFYYDIEDEDKIIPALFTFGSEIKVVGPQSMQEKIASLLEKQRGFFSMNPKLYFK